MTERERKRDRPRPERRTGDGPDSATGAEALDRTRERTADLLDAGLAAIARGLSADSEAYVRSLVQDGGQ